MPALMLNEPDVAIRSSWQSFWAFLPATSAFLLQQKGMAASVRGALGPGVRRGSAGSADAPEREPAHRRGLGRDRSAMRKWSSKWPAGNSVKIFVARKSQLSIRFLNDTFMRQLNHSIVGGGVCHVFGGKHIIIIILGLFIISSWSQCPSPSA